MLRFVPACVVVVSLVSVAPADILDVSMTGTVASTELERGPFAGAEVGDPVEITFRIDTDLDIGFGEFHRYDVTDYVVRINDVEMTPSTQPTFGFTTFFSFHGFDNTSTGLLLPGGGVDHNYRLPVFGASGPPTIWPPDGSSPEDHLGSTDAALFDVFNDNTIIDSGGGGQGIDHDLVIDFNGAIVISSPGDAPTLVVNGPCPGTVEAVVSGATPGGTVALVYSLSGGSTTIPDGVPCAGLVLDLGIPLIPGAPLILTADGAGEASAMARVPAIYCGSVRVQAVDATTCVKSNLVIVN